MTKIQAQPPELAWLPTGFSRSLVERIEEWARIQPEKAMLIGQDYAVSYGELLVGMQAGAAWLHDRGVRQGDTVAFTLPRDAQATRVQIELFAGLAWLGALVLPLYAEVPLERHRALAVQFGARWQLGAGHDPERTPELTQFPVSLDLGGYIAQRSHWIGRTAHRGASATQPLIYEFTSGTTGTPKVMCFTSQDCVNNVLGFAHIYRWHANEILLPPLQWPTKVGIRGVVRALTVGTSVLDHPFPQTWPAFVNLIDNMGAGFITASPWQVRRLLASQDAGDQPPIAPFGMGVGGAPMTAQEIEAARSRLTPRLHVVYGTTELGPMAHLPPEDDATAAMRLVDGMTCEALDSHTKPIPLAHAGQLRFCAAWLPVAYAHAGGNTHTGFHNGWFVSSDLGTVHGDGRLVVAGRCDDTINVGGSKVQPNVVEQVLLTHPDIADAAVVGVPDPMAGEQALAFLVLRQPLSLSAIAAFLAPVLDSWQVPVGALAVHQIPRNPEGKILRETLRAAYCALQAHQLPQQ